MNAQHMRFLQSNQYSVCCILYPVDVASMAAMVV